AERPTAEFCENGAKAYAEEATGKRCTPELLERFSLEELRALSDFELGQLGRLTHPMVLAGDRYRPISWDGAFEMLGDALRALPNPDRASFYTSGRTSNE